MDPQQYSPQPSQPTQPYQPGIPLPNKRSGINRTVVIAVLAVLTVIFLALSIWFFMQKQSLQQTYDADVQVAVNQALSEQETRLREEFESIMVADTATFDGPDVLGNVQFSYPKTWSVVANTNDTGKNRLEVTIHPQAITNTATAFALKMFVIDETYAEQVEDYQNKVEKGELTSKPVEYSGVSGIRLDGQIDKDLTGSIVLLPIRDRTLVLQTESDSFGETYEQALKTLTLSP